MTARNLPHPSTKIATSGRIIHHKENSTRGNSLGTGMSLQARATTANATDRQSHRLPGISGIITVEHSSLKSQTANQHIQCTDHERRYCICTDHEHRLSRIL